MAAKHIVIGLPHLDALAGMPEPSIRDYCKAAAESSETSVAETPARSGTFRSSDA
jgi:hypothetical protein